MSLKLAYCVNAMVDNTEEILAAYTEACKPFIEGGGAITAKECDMHSWRYFLEVNSACNLECPTCTKGNKEGYDHKNGLMEEELMQQCIDKIKRENPDAIVFLYGNSEPFLHPRLAHCIRSVKARGLNCQLSTNLNFIRNVEEVIAAQPNFIIISLSGYTQETYVKGHAGGHIDKVLANMRVLAAEHHRQGNKFPISVNYHVYNDNHHEIELMKEFATNIGIGFFTSKARAISMENAIQYCRSKDPQATPYEVQPNRPDWNHVFPVQGINYPEAMKRIEIPPDTAVEMYKKYPVCDVCPVGAGSIFTFIRHDGKTQLCACVADRRVILTDYLKTTPIELMKERTGHAICKQCIKYRLNLYFMIADREKWV